MDDTTVQKVLAKIRREMGYVPDIGKVIVIVKKLEAGGYPRSKMERIIAEFIIPDVRE